MKTVKKLIILGGGTAGWMAASYLSKALGNKIEITLIESPSIPKIGVGEATIPNLQKVFFDFLGLKEKDWMPYCNASFKTAIKFIGWNNGAESDYFYHMFGQIKDVNGVPLTHFWNERKTSEPMAYACYDKARSLDKKLSPIGIDGTPRMSYAWHFDAHLVANFLKNKSIEWGVKHIEGEYKFGTLAEDGYISSITLNNGDAYTADLFIDCTGFRGLLINKLMDEPFIDMSQYLLCDSAVATAIPHDDEKHGVEPYTSAIAMKSGWTWKIPLLGRFGSGYVYSSKFCDKNTAQKEFSDLWGLNQEDTNFNHIKFRTGRNRRTWVKNCVSVGLSSCFLEPLESTGLYFIYAAIYQLAQHFPSPEIDERQINSFNKKIEMMFDDSRDFIQMHYLMSNRDDTAFWKSSKSNIVISDSLKEKMETFSSGLIVCPPVTTNENDYYSNIENEFYNFWTNSNYYCILAGLGKLPNKTHPKLFYNEELHNLADEEFKKLKDQGEKLLAELPHLSDYLKNTRGVKY